MEIAKEFKFEASHTLPNHPGLCANLHGHSWKLQVAIDGDIKEDGMVMDYADLKAKVQPIVDQLDHSYFGCWENDRVKITPKSTKVPDFRPFPFDNPTSENILIAIGNEIWKKGIKFSRIMLEETCTTTCYIEQQEFIEKYLIK